MVSTFCVWLPEENRTVFANINEEGGSLTTCDYICTDIDYEDSMTIDSFVVDLLEKTDKYFALYQYCLMEYIKRDQPARLPMRIIPESVFRNVGPEYIEWHILNVGELFVTDGEKIIIDESYDCEPDPVILNVKKFQQYVQSEMSAWSLSNDEKLMEKFYSLPIVVGFGERLITLDNSAASYQALETFLKEFLDNY